MGLSRPSSIAREMGADLSVPGPVGLSSTEAQGLLAEVGPNAIPEPAPRPFRDLARRFWGPVPWMLEVALALEVLLQKVPEALILAALLVFNAVLAEVQEHRARLALDLLRRRLHVMARVLRDGTWESLPAEEVVPGDLLHLKAGDVVPADCALVEGEVEVDQSTLTGESEPVVRGLHTTLYSSSIVRRGAASATVVATGPKSYFGKTADLVRTAKSGSHLEALLFGVVRYLVVLDSLMAIAVLTVATLRATPLTQVVPFVLILLIASVPVAMPTAFTIANALESRRLVERGLLVTGLTAVQDAASMDILFIDKTGTLTEGRETVQTLSPFHGWSETTLLSLANVACDHSSGASLDTAIGEEAQRRGVPQLLRRSYTPFDPARKRSEATVEFENKEQRVVLGSPSEVAKLSRAGGIDLQQAATALSSTGARVVAVALGSQEPLECVGLLSLADQARADAPSLIRTLKDLGVRVVMLTGDTLPTAKAIARSVGLGPRIGQREDLSTDPGGFDGFAGVYPDDKHQLVKTLQKQHHVVGMTGDGVNDAPALKQAEVGIAVATSTDVAKASAKLVLTRPGLTDIVNAVEGGRQVYRRMLTWTLNKISKNLELVLLLAGGYLLAGIFVTTPFLVLVLVFANDFVTMSTGTDRASPSPVPDRWNLREILGTAAVVGLSWLAVSYGLLWWALKVGDLSLGAVQTLFFVYLVVASQGTILSVRERGPLWSSRPSGVLLAAAAADILAVSALALSGLLVPAALSLSMVLTILGVVGCAALLIDQVKAAFIRWTDAFGPRSRLVSRPGATSPQ